MRAKILILSIIYLLIMPGVVMSLDVNPKTVVVDVEPYSEKVVYISIVNNENQSETVDIQSSDPEVLIPSVEHLTLSPNAVYNLSVMVRSPGVGEFTPHLTISNSNPYVVMFSVRSTMTEGLEPLYSRRVITTIPDITTEFVVTFKNKFADEIDIKDVTLEGVILTEGGLTKPLRIKSVTYGKLDPGQDLPVTLILDTTDLPFPKTYSCALKVVYYYNNKRYESSVNFDITVAIPLPTSRKLDIVMTPENAKIGDKISLELVNAENKTVKYGTITVEIYQDGELKRQFIYNSPFEIKTPGKYCFIGEAKYYNTVKKCVVFETGLIFIKLSNPTPLPNETILVTAVDKNGEIVDDAHLIIDGKEYNSPQISIAFSEGTHTITAYAKGYESISRTIDVLRPLKIVNITLPEYVGDRLFVKFNRKTLWDLVCGNYTLEGETDVIALIANVTGNCTLSAEDIVKKFYVKESLMSSLIERISPKNNLYMYIAIGVIVLVVIIVRSGRRQKASHITMKSIGIKSPLKGGEE